MPWKNTRLRALSPPKALARRWTCQIGRPKTGRASPAALASASTALKHCRCSPSRRNQLPSWKGPFVRSDLHQPGKGSDGPMKRGQQLRKTIYVLPSRRLKDDTATPPPRRCQAADLAIDAHSIAAGRGAANLRDTAGRGSAEAPRMAAGRARSVAGEFSNRQEGNRLAAEPVRIGVSSLFEADRVDGRGRTADRIMSERGPFGTPQTCHVTGL